MLQELSHFRKSTIFEFSEYFIVQFTPQKTLKIFDRMENAPNPSMAIFITRIFILHSVTSLVVNALCGLNATEPEKVGERSLFNASMQNTTTYWSECVLVKRRCRKNVKNSLTLSVWIIHICRSCEGWILIAYIKKCQMTHPTFCCQCAVGSPNYCEAKRGHLPCASFR